MQAILQGINATIPALTWDVDRKIKFEDKLVEYASKLSFSEGKSGIFEDKLKNVLLIAELLKSKDMAEIIKFTIKKAGSDCENYGVALLKSYSKISDLYDAQELLDMSGFINIMTITYFDLQVTSFSGSDIFEVAKLLSNAYDILQKKLSGATSFNYNKNFDEEHMKFGKLLSDFFASTGDAWISLYKDKLNKVKSDDTAANIYDLIVHIMSIKPSSMEIKNFLGNVVLRSTDFEAEIAWAFDAHEQVNKDHGAAHANPKDLDDIIAKYYWTIFMIDGLNETLFDNLRSIGFDVLAKIEPLIQLINARSSKNEQLRAREALCNALNTLPRDWFMDDKRVESVIIDFGGIPIGFVSKSSEYIDKYDYLFKGTTNSKYGRYKYEHPYLTDEKNTSAKSSSGSSRGCYIATCVYGSYDCPEVWLLRRYRDYYLDESWFGRLFIKIYYEISPRLVKWFGKSDWFKKMWKPFLERKIKRLREKGYDETVYYDKS